MNDDEIWDLAGKPVAEFIESIKEMDLNVDRLVKFYLEHTRQNQSEKVDGPIKQHGTRPNDKLTDNKQILSPLACAKLELAIVFSINTCYWMYLVTHGEDPNKNDISKDIERIRLFMNRAKEVEESSTGSCSSSKRPRIDKDASKRLCVNNMSLKSSW